jgi:hypothetical protein
MPTIKVASLTNGGGKVLLSSFFGFAEGLLGGRDGLVESAGFGQRGSQDVE